MEERKNCMNVRTVQLASTKINVVQGLEEIGALV